MASNKDTILKVKNNTGNYIPVLPITTKDQVISWDVGELKGPFILTIKANAWVRNKQAINLTGVNSSNILNCVPVFNGSKEEQLAQLNAYNKLLHVGGIQSLNNQVMFVCDEVPQTDIKVQVWWTI